MRTDGLLDNYCADLWKLNLLKTGIVFADAEDT